MPGPNAIDEVLRRMLDAQLQIVERLNRLEGQVKMQEQTQEAFLREVAEQQVHPTDELLQMTERISRNLSKGVVRNEPG